MPRGSDPTEPPPAKSPMLSSPTTTINSLGEDLLLEIFLRLPSLATLVRAALTCRPWRRAVASSPAFRRRFRELHPAPLLGLIVEPKPDALPAFSPAQCRDRDVLAAIRCGDFAFTPLLDPEDHARNAPLRWRIQDCRGGYLLLMNWDASLLAAINPLVPGSAEYFEMPFNTESPAEHPDQRPVSLDVHLLSSDEDPMQFQLVWLLYEKSRVQALVFSSDTGDWYFLPWVEIEEKAPPHDAGQYWLRSGWQANGALYWPFKNQEHMLKLDTETMKFSVSELPPYLKGQQGCHFVVGETRNGSLCIVYCTGLSIGVLMNIVDDDGVERWVLSGMVHYEAEADLPVNNRIMQVVAIEDGFVYLATSEMVLVLCLETMKLEKLFPRSFRSHHFHPYVMAWPTSLLGNYGSFVMIQDGANDVN
ncbi:unnamed protein product [Urochloa decumbens]|uniref:F-box domain-containing protein n=1 Tax=Urochloa decumbens TaxID=240449 RepID=A0ABC8ZN09_9POAL